MNKRKLSLPPSANGWDGDSRSCRITTVCLHHLKESSYSSVSLS